MNNLATHTQRLAAGSLADLVNSPGHQAQWTFHLGPLLVDLSKNFLDGQTRELWQQWFNSLNLKEKIAAIAAGELVNGSEKRPVLHHLLRQPTPKLFTAEIQAMRQQLRQVAEELRGQHITDLVHIGIGGSELGMKLLCHGLYRRRNGQVKVHFLAGTDSDYIEELQRLNPQTTALIIASKTFSTEETLLNARHMRDWLLAHDKNAGQRIVAISANVAAAKDFGIDPARVLPMWDWVGGRFSLSSALALPLILQNSYGDYEELLAGMHLVDEHFYGTDLMANLPVLLAALDASYNRFLQVNERAVITYNRPLRDFPAFLQQLFMESLGKNCDSQGKPLKERSGLVIFGGSGTECQHSFFQLLHQGNHLIPLDFITVKAQQPAFSDAQEVMLAHCVVLAEALMLGRKTDRQEQFSPGNRPSNFFILEELTPASLGALIALYEHKASVEALLYGINAYDQWGVEYGKILAKNTRATLAGQRDAAGDASTVWLLQQLRP